MNRVVDTEIDTETDELLEDEQQPIVSGVPERGIVRRRISEAQVKRVIKLISMGNSERQACKTVGINSSSFRQAVTRLRVSEEYARATASMAEEQINKMEETIEDLRAGKITSDMARVELEARKWFASKLLPKKYGDKVEHNQNIQVSFMNGVPRPKVIEGDAISSVPKQIAENTTSD